MATKKSKNLRVGYHHIKSKDSIERLEAAYDVIFSKARNVLSEERLKRFR